MITFLKIDQNILIAVDAVEADVVLVVVVGFVVDSDAEDVFVVVSSAIPEITRMSQILHKQP